MEIRFSTTSGAFQAKDDFWEYDPGSDSWKQKPNLGTAVSYASGFAIGQSGYLAGGATGITTFTSQLWSFTPLTSGVFPGTYPDPDIRISPNPFRGLITVENLPPNSTSLIRIFTVTGSTVVSTRVRSQRTDLDLSGIPGKGVYILEISNESGPPAVFRIIRE